MTKLILPLLLLLTLVCQAQTDRIQISGTVHNDLKQTVPDVNITIIGTKIGTTTNKSGKFSFDLVTDESFTIRFSHISYEDKDVKVSINKIAQAKGKLNYQISLNSRINKLDGFIVSDIQKPDTVFGTYKFSISDYEFIDEGLLLLHYPKKLKKGGHISIVTTDQRLLSTLELSFIPTELFQDYMGNVYVLSKTNARRVLIENKKIVGLETIPIDQFAATIKPCLDTLDSKIIHNDYLWYKPYFNYYMFNPVDTSSKKILEIEDAELHHMYRMEYYFMSPRDKLFAAQFAVDHNVDKQEVGAMMTDFANSIYYEPLYAPLHVINDTMFVFDHYRDQILMMNEYGEKIDSVAIDYHLNKNEKYWKEAVVKDNLTDDLYVPYLVNGYYRIKGLNHNNGKTFGEHKLFFKFVENIKISDGYIYYIYRPFESLQKKFLYKEAIKL